MKVLKRLDNAFEKVVLTGKVHAALSYFGPISKLTFFYLYGDIIIENDKKYVLVGKEENIYFDNEEKFLQFLLMSVRPKNLWKC